jgi:hypothetical protein
MPNVFGNLGALRDANDLYTIQYGAALFGAFTRQLAPTPATAYLQTRGYTTVLDAVQKSGQWEPISGTSGPVRLIDYLPAASGFVDVPQCAFLNYSLEYYLDGH